MKAARPGEVVRFAAADPRAGMTLGELRKVLALADRIELPETSRITVETGWRTQLQSIELRRDPTP